MERRKPQVTIDLGGKRTTFQLFLHTSVRNDKHSQWHEILGTILFQSDSQKGHGVLEHSLCPWLCLKLHAHVLKRESEFKSLFEQSW